MADELTPNIGLIKPDVGASDDTWGDKLNYNFDLLDGRIPSDLGIYVTDAELAAILAGYATDAEVAAGYAPISHTHTASQITDFSEATDDRVAGLLVAGTNVTLNYNDPANTLTINSTASGVPATAVPLVESGTGAVGVSAKYAREDHVHPLGPGGGGGASVTISDTPPGSPTAGNLWWESDTGNLYIYYNDGSSSQWVLVQPNVSAASLNAVTYTPQTLTTAQQTQAQANIGLAPDFAWSCGTLIKSGANIQLNPLIGSLLTINGVNAKIPNAGVTLAATGLTVGTLYYIYATQSSGIVNALEASTTAYAISTTAGSEGLAIKTGDATRRLVGMVRPIAGPAFSDTSNQRFVRSWLNRKSVALVGTGFSGTTTSTVPVEISTTARLEFLAFSDET
jgi:hypothetical protein